MVRVTATGADMDRLLVSIKQNLKRFGFVPTREVSPLVFKGGFVPGRPGFLLREGVVSLDVTNNSAVSMQASIKISLVSYVILGLVAVLANTVFFFVGKDIQLFAVVANVLLLYVPVYWKIKSMQLERNILKVPQS